MGAGGQEGLPGWTRLPSAGLWGTVVPPGSEEVGLCSFVTGMGGGCPWGWDKMGQNGTSGTSGTKWDTQIVSGLEPFVLFHCETRPLRF